MVWGQRQNNETEGPEIDHHVYHPVIYEKGGIAVQWGNDVLYNK